MSSFGIQQVSKSVYNITRGEKKVGFVRAYSEGVVGKIGNYQEIAKTAKRAFEMAASKSIDFASPEALSAQNAAVRQQNAQISQEARHAVSELQKGNFDPLLDMFKKDRNFTKSQLAYSCIGPAPTRIIISQSICP